MNLGSAFQCVNIIPRKYMKKSLKKLLKLVFIKNN